MFFEYEKRDSSSEPSLSLGKKRALARKPPARKTSWLPSSNGSLALDHSLEKQRNAIDSLPGYLNGNLSVIKCLIQMSLYVISIVEIFKSYFSRCYIARCSI